VDDLFVGAADPDREGLDEHVTVRPRRFRDVVNLRGRSGHRLYGDGPQPLFPIAASVDVQRTARTHVAIGLRVHRSIGVRIGPSKVAEVRTDDTSQPAAPHSAVAASRT
jgi:hypothetical protein